MPEEENYYTPGEVAKMLGLSEWTIRTLLTSEQLEGSQDELARWWIPAAAVDAARHGQSAGNSVDPSAEETPMAPASLSRSEITPVSEEPTQPEAGGGPVPQTASTDAAGETSEPGWTATGMANDTPRRKPWHTDDAYAPIDQSNRRISTQDVHARSGWTTTAIAARALGVAQRTVQSYVQKGTLEAKSEGEGVKKTLYISIDSLNALRAQRIAEGKIGADMTQDASTEHGAELAEVVGKLASRMADEAARAAELEARLELTAQAETTLREQLQQERNEARRLRAELEAERSKGFWRRLFGG